MTSLDPSHLPDFSSKQHRSRGEAVVHPSRPGQSGSQLHIPAIPDLRFEQSYLKSIAPYVHTRRTSRPSVVDKHGDTDGSVDVDGVEVVKIDWRNVVWITTRDQLVSPLLQGAIWGVASLFIRPLFASILSFLGFTRRPYSPRAPQIKREGELTKRLREWSKSLTTSGLEANIALSK